MSPFYERVPLLNKSRQCLKKSQFVMGWVKRHADEVERVRSENCCNLFCESERQSFFLREWSSCMVESNFGGENFLGWLFLLAFYDAFPTRFARQLIKLSPIFAWAPFSSISTFCLRLERNMNSYDIDRTLEFCQNRNNGYVVQILFFRRFLGVNFTENEGFQQSRMKI